MAGFDYTGGSRQKEIIEPDPRVREYLWINQGYYMGKYYKMQKKGTSFSWNTAAFFFPVQWFCYRKMYLEAVVIWLVRQGLGLGLMYFFWGQYFNVLEELTRISFERRLDMAVAEALSLLCVPVFVLLLFHLIIAFFANSYYLGKIEKLVKGEKLLHKGEITAQRVAKRGINEWAMLLSLLLSLLPDLLNYVYKLI